MKLLIQTGLFFCAVVSFAETLYTREISVGGNSQSPLSAALVLFLPESVKGVRLKDMQGNIQPLTILRKNGGRCELFFNSKSGEKRILEYLDFPVQNINAEQKSGLLHQYKSFDGATVNSIDEFQKHWNNSVASRSGWEKRIYLGANSLGNPGNSLNWYRGFLKIEKSGNYTFHTASTDASFLLIDGKLIAAYPGRHWISPAQTGRFKGDVNLDAGIHKIEYLHANNQWSYYAIAAYSRPGDKRMTILPEDMFLPLLPVSCGTLKKIDGSDASDLSWKTTGILDIDGRQMREFTFSDGDTVYRFDNKPFRKKEYIVSSAYDHAAPFVSNQKAREMLRGALLQDEREPLDETGYRFLADAIPMFHADHLSKIFYERIVRKGNQMPQDSVFKFYRAMIMDSDLAEERYEKIEKELLRMVGKNTDHTRLELAKLYFYCMNREADAEREFRLVNTEKLTPDFLHDYRVLEGDMTLFSKGYDEAWNVYRKLESSTRKMSEREKLEADGYLVSLRNALITKRYQDAADYLERVEKARPEIRLNPDVMWLKARFLDRLKRSRLAAWYAAAVLKMQPSESTSAAALLYLGKTELNRGNRVKGTEFLHEILKQYPKSAEAIAAEQYLNGGSQ